MDEHQASEMIALLAEIASELRDLRSAFDEFRGWGADNMKDHADRLTGPTGYHMEDLNGKLGDVAHSLALIEINTSG